MANPDHVKELLKGVEHWNEWLYDQRRQDPDFCPDLIFLNIWDQAYLHTNLFLYMRDSLYIKRWVPVPNLQGICLDNAYLFSSDFHNANLSKASLQNAKLNNTNLSNAIFNKSNLKNISAIESNFKYCISQHSNFENAYFRNVDFTKAKIHNSNLLYSRFLNSNIFGAEFKNSDMRNVGFLYSNFKGCNFENINFNRWGRYQGLRLEGAYGSQRFLRHAKDQDFIEEFRDWDVDMRPWKWPWKRLLQWKTWRFWKWNLNPRTWKWRFFLLYLPWLIFADCGRSFLLWSAWSVFFALGFGSVYADHHLWGLLPQWAIPDMKLPAYDSWFSPYYFSIVTFTTLGFGDVTPLNMAGEFWVTAEVILGYVMLGGLISIFANKLARRSG